MGNWLLGTHPCLQISTIYTHFGYVIHWIYSLGLDFWDDVNFLFHFWLNGFVGYFWEVSMFNIERLFLLLSLIRVFLVSWVDEILPLYL